MRNNKQQQTTMGERLKSIRIHFKLNQMNFAKKIDASISTISDLENDKYKPSFEIFLGLGDKYNVNLYYLFYELGGMLILPGSMEAEIITSFQPHLMEEKAFYHYFEYSELLRSAIISAFKSFYLDKRSIIELEIKNKGRSNDNQDHSAVSYLDTATLTDSIGKRVRHFRNVSGLLQTQFAENLQTTVSIISEIENDRYRLNHEILDNLVNKFNANIHYILWGKGPMLLSLDFLEKSLLNFNAGRRQEEKAMIFYFQNSRIVRFHLLRTMYEILEIEGSKIEQEVAMSLGKAMPDGFYAGFLEHGGEIVFNR